MILLGEPGAEKQILLMKTAHGGFVVIFVENKQEISHLSLLSGL
jgi:predicted ATPase